MNSQNRIDAVFKNRKAEERKVLIGYVTAGYPDKAGFKRLVPMLERAGLDMLEIGVPFSDPIADGTTIQKSSQLALANGVTLSWVLESVTALRSHVQLPLVLMSYSNPILSMGIETFFRAAAKAGVDGLIVPDLIPEEASIFQVSARAQSVRLIYLVSPTTPKKRMAWIARQTEGFLYAVALAGVTGARTKLDSKLPQFLREVRRASPMPVAVGFGLSTPAHVARIAPQADGVIVGSALIKAIGESKKNSFQDATAFVASLRKALDQTFSKDHCPKGALTHAS